MKILNVSETRQNLSNLITEAAESHKPIYIKGKNNSVALISHEKLEKLEEAAYLYSISKYINIGNLDKSIEEYAQGKVIKKSLEEFK